MAKFSRISKSQYVKGVRCPKMLWLYRHRPDLAPEISEGKQHIFDTGHKVGILAQKCFEGGLEITEPYYKIDRAIKSTQKAVRDGRDIIFEATACSDDGAFSRIDILKKVEGTDAWDLIEVKSSTGVEDYHLDDIALQRYAFSEAGYDIRKSKLMHIDKKYVRSGDLDPKKLFKIEDCTDRIIDRMIEVKITVRDLIATLDKNKEPDAEIGSPCKKPFKCDYFPYCWKEVPDYSVYNVFRGRKREELLSQGIIDISSVPDNFELTDKQRTAVNAYKTNEIHCNRDEIVRFLERLEYPIYFLDYEAIWWALPLFDHSSPYQHIPFQFSLHIQNQKGEEPEHVEFLHTQMGDPRPDFIKTLIEKCGKKGSVVVFNQTYESRINRELGRDFPEYESDLLKINNRIIDIREPFRARHLYHPDMQGSDSLKSVLPAFVPGMSYDDLDISDGEIASIRYLGCIKNQVDDDQKRKIFSNLKKYCCRDTLAEVKLLNVLYNI